MPLSATAYAGLNDLRYGDIPLPAYAGDGSSYINEASDEIDAMLGHIYVTPIVIPDLPENRPARLLLKKINWLIASGRLILNLAAAGESTTLNSYGSGMLKEGLDLLKRVSAGDIVLTGAPTIETNTTGFTGPVIFNEDSYSLVQSFYDNYNSKNYPAETIPGQHVVDPYGNVQ